MAMAGSNDDISGRTDAAGYLVLDREQCLRYLATGGVGRIAVNVGALPAILPVHFALSGEHVVFTIAPGSTLDRATRDAVVAFEADGHDGDDSAPWSVTATGMARHVDDNEFALAAVDRLPAWAPTAARRVVTVSTDYLSGRRRR
jgi:nitroimidazol reductase NimA-like FMN-containing flavoprotein (pyridoxamine 5'-phosphate oxidase superfamily)